MFPLIFACIAGLAFAASLLFFLYSYIVTFGVVPEEGSRAIPVVIDVVLFSVFALHHSLFARTALKGIVSRVAGRPLERAVYTLIASALFAAVCWYWQPVPGVLYTLEGPWRWLAYIALAAGLILTAVGAAALDVLELAGVRQVTRTQRPAVLKTDGLYGFVRHPVYFAWILIVLGVPAMTMTRLTFAVISTLYLAIAIPFEERSLVATFGPDYASYQQQVRWRMIPGLY